MITNRTARRGTAATILLLACSMLTVVNTRAEASSGDPVSDWNVHAVNALTNLPTASPFPGAGQALPGLLHLAMVQGAVYDAVNAIDGGHQPYLEGLPAVSSEASVDAAVATAAHAVLVGLTNPTSGVKILPPATKGWLDAEYTAALGAIADGEEKAAGVAIGTAAAHMMLAERADDGRYVPFSFTQGTEVGQWRDTGSGSDPFAWIARVRPFLVESTSQFRTDGPLDIDSSAYEEEYDEVKALGSATSTSRTAEQTTVALFYREGTITLWNRTFRDIAAAEGLGSADEARLFAMLNLVGADAAINCWDDKDHYAFWRPITAIRLGESDGNPDTVGDPTWTPLGVSPAVAGVTPPYPDHPSGYNCITGAMLRAATAFFGTNAMTFTVRSTTSAAERNYVRFSEVPKDTIDARVYLGIHFRTADVQGAVLGRKLATWAVKRYFLPAN